MGSPRSLVNRIRKSGVISPITLEALSILDAIERRGSFAAAANELNRAPSSLSYQIQKLEQDLDITIFDRSGHKASFTQAGRLILERGRLILELAGNMVEEANIIANGWELDLTIAYDGIIPISSFFPVIEALGQQSQTRIKLQEEILAGAWESLSSGRSDLLICPAIEGVSQDIKVQTIGSLSMVWVAAVDHPVHKRTSEFDDQTRLKYRVIAISDTAREQPTMSINVLDKQPRLTVTNFASKLDALVAGLGIGTLPEPVANKLIAQGKLQQIDGAVSRPIDIVLAWRRNQLGKAKSWLIKYLTNHWQLGN
ncbi:LysR family transcriptional regulator [Vibrio sp. WXL103]|uniref:LysR family transcriptional regulator n=1 Tax=Vibrio sp. WXL103 TaxID=3450710 RepID=UPI003EC8BB5C